MNVSTICLTLRVKVENNRLDVEKTVALAGMAFDEDPTKMQVARELANQCVGVTDADRCEAGIKIFECGRNAAESLGLSFEDL